MPEHAEWCGLCFTDLRPQPEPMSAEPRPAPAPSPQRSPLTPAAGLDPLSAPIAVLDGSGQTATPVLVAPNAQSLTWPCSACGASVDVELPACPTCGAAFLAPLRDGGDLAVELPLVGNVLGLSRGSRLALAAGVAVVLIALLTGLAAVLGLAL